MEKQYSYPLFLLSSKRLELKKTLNELRRIDAKNDDRISNQIKQLDNAIESITDSIKSQTEINE